MKKIIIVVLSVMFMFSCFENSFARNYGQRNYKQRQPVHHKNHHNKDNNLGLAAVLGGVLVLEYVLNGGRQQPVTYQQPVSYQSRAVLQRERQHEMAIQRYYDCLGQREVDIRYGVHPQDAKDCSRLDPRNRNWR